MSTCLKNVEYYIMSPLWNNYGPPLLITLDTVISQPDLVGIYKPNQELYLIPKKLAWSVTGKV